MEYLSTASLRFSPVIYISRGYCSSSESSIYKVGTLFFFFYEQHRLWRETYRVMMISYTYTDLYCFGSLLNLEYLEQWFGDTEYHKFHTCIHRTRFNLLIEIIIFWMMKKKQHEYYCPMACRKNGKIFRACRNWAKYKPNKNELTNLTNTTYE